jgi:hypothetical protein
MIIDKENSKKYLDERIRALQLQDQEIIYRQNHFYPQFEKKLLDQYLRLKGNIRVFIRIRPILPNDFKAYEGTRESFTLLESQLQTHNT